jgi:predicted nucleic acid-binding protein
MAARPFLDTNVLVYAFSDQDARSGRATTVIAAGGIVSVQVLNEFVDVARRKLRKDWPAVQRAVQDLRTLLDPPLPVTAELHEAAIELARKHDFRIYDSLILSAARLAGCRVLYTEDLGHGQEIEGVLVQNPFLELPGC